MANSVDPRTLKSWLHQPGEIALLDVREAGQFGEAHLFFATSLPYSRVEVEALRLVPRLATRIVLCDGGDDGIAALASRRLEALGYSDVHILAGGTKGWLTAGFKLFAGVNVPSKAFGEIVEERLHTPRITADDLRAMVARGENLVIVDGRPYAEFQMMNIPGGICCPNGELATRIGEIAPDPKTRIVVNCAGRTRSIIGAETLRRLGVPNPVCALENGTQGWFLAGLQLEHQSKRKYPQAPQGAAIRPLQARARQLAIDSGVPLIKTSQAAEWLADTTRTTYLVDVRTPEEFAAGGLPGAAHAPGGQLVQATDQWVGTRGARILLADGEGVRAVMIATWLRQMGHDACVLIEGVLARLSAPPPAVPQLPKLPGISPKELKDATLIDLRSSTLYRASHAVGAIWSIRPRVVAAATGASRAALISDDPMIARAAALDLMEAGVETVFLLQGDLPQEGSPHTPSDFECIDFLFFTHGRHEGNREAALQYLKWEMNLVSELDADERDTYRI